MTAAGVAIAGMIVGGATVIGDKRYGVVHDQAAVQLAHERGVAVGDVPEKLIDQRLGEWSGINTAWHGWNNIRTGLHDQLWPTDGGNGPDPTQAGFANNVTGVGNFTDPNPHVIWNLTPHNMDPAGYWINDTWSAADACTPGADPPVPCDGDRLNWFHDTSEAESSIVKFPTAPDTAVTANPNAQWIEVSGTVYRSDFEQVDGSGSEAYFGLPMLPDSELVAATFDGKETSVVSRQNGTMAIYLAHPKEQLSSGEATVTYWFQKTAHAINPHQYVYRHKNDGTQFYDHGQPLLPDKDPAIQAIFAKQVPGYAAAGNDSDKKRQAIIDYLSDDFLYSYTPMTNDEQKHIKSWADFTAAVLDGKIANCNVATTLLVLADPRLSAASGFINAPGDGVDQLTSGERHMVGLDGDHLVDATPSGLANLNKSDTSVSAGSLMPWLLLAGALQSASVILLTRRQAMEMVRRYNVRRAVHAADSAETELRAFGPFALNLAADAADASAWAPKGEVGLTYISGQAERHVAAGYDQARTRVSSPAFRDPATLERLERQAWRSPAITRVHELAQVAAARPPYHRRRK